MPAVNSEIYQSPLLVCWSVYSKITREEGTVPLPSLVHLFLTNAARTPQFSFLPTLDTVEQLTAHSCTPCKVLAWPVPRLLELDNGELLIFDEIHGVLICLISVMVVHGELILVGDSDMELLIFVQKLEELVAQDTLVPTLVGMDNEILKVFDELRVLGISEMLENERRRLTVLL